MEMTVAHRLRNLLMSMMGNMTFLREELKQGRGPDKFLEDMDRAILGASNYTRWLQLLSEKRTVSVTPVDLNDCSRESLDYLHSHPTENGLRMGSARGPRAKIGGPPIFLRGKLPGEPPSSTREPRMFPKAKIHKLTFLSQASFSSGR